MTTRMTIATVAAAATLMLGFAGFAAASTGAQAGNGWERKAATEIVARNGADDRGGDDRGGGNGGKGRGGKDDGPNHDAAPAGHDELMARKGADDGPNHDAGDDKGGDRGGNGGGRGRGGHDDGPNHG